MILVGTLKSWNGDYLCITWKTMNNFFTFVIHVSNSVGKLLYVFDNIIICYQWCLILIQIPDNCSYTLKSIINASFLKSAVSAYPSCLSCHCRCPLFIRTREWGEMRIVDDDLHPKCCSKPLTYYMLLLQARLQARQVKNEDKRHHYKGLSCDNLFLYHESGS